MNANRGLGAVKELMRRDLIFAAFVGLALNLLVLSSPIYKFQILDRVLTTGHPETLFFLPVLALFAILIFGHRETCRGRIPGRLGFALEGILREPAFGAWTEPARKASVARHPPVADLLTIRDFHQGSGPSAIRSAVSRHRRRSSTSR